MGSPLSQMSHVEVSEVTHLVLRGFHRVLARNDAVLARSWDSVHTWSKTEPLAGHLVDCWRLGVMTC